MNGSLSSVLALGILLGLFHILLYAALVTASRGLQWNLGNRDADSPAPPVHAARAQRATRNFLETFPFFAAAAVCAIAIGREGQLAELGAQLWFWARVVYLPVYVIGIPVVRSLVWGVALAGVLMMVFAIL